MELTTGTATSQLATAVDMWLKSQDITQAEAYAHAGQPLAAMQALRPSAASASPGWLQAARDRSEDPGSGQGGAAERDRDGDRQPSCDLVRRRAGQLRRRQVRGFIFAELITGAALITLLAVGGEWLIGRGLSRWTR